MLEESQEEKTPNAGTTGTKITELYNALQSDDPPSRILDIVERHREEFKARKSLLFQKMIV